MAVLQAWPGRGFWQGRLAGQPGSLATMTSSMAPTSQPHVFSAWIDAFTAFDEAHGFAVNLFTVIALAAIGALFLTLRPRLIRPALACFIVLCLADWVLIEDFGFFGGLGTDPNSMVPMALLAVSGYLALGPGVKNEPAEEPVPAVTTTDKKRLSLRRPDWLGDLRPARLARGFAATSTRAVLATWAVVIILIGAAPMAVAQTSRNADPIIAQALDGDSSQLNYAAPAFQLTDQYGKQVSLASMRGKVVLLTFLDPVCTSDCPVIGLEFAQADQLLGAKSGNVEMVAIVANPLYRSIAYMRAFDNEDQLGTLPNWLYLTGSLAQLQLAWKNYGVAAEILPAGGMIGHSDVAYVIDANGHTRTELNFDPGPGTSSSESSFAVELTDAARQVMKS
jgi:cytochrome oxidase Cu insertion factor (SCO1/SenC/PrrC family)